MTTWLQNVNVVIFTHLWVSSRSICGQPCAQKQRDYIYVAFFCLIDHSKHFYINYQINSFTHTLTQQPADQGYHGVRIAQQYFKMRVGEIRTESLLSS